MLSSQASTEQASVERLSALEHQLVQMTAERNQLVHEREPLAHERDQLAHERDQYKSRAEWLETQLERLRYDAKTPREHVDPRQIQLVFEPFAQALLGTQATADAPDGSDEDAATAPDPDDHPHGNKKKKRKVTPHGRRVLPEHLPVETIVLTPCPLAPAPDEMIPRGLPTIDLLAHVLVGKFADKLPYHRQEGILAREGVPLTRAVMCGWTQAAHALAHHVVDAMEQDARAHAHVNCPRSCPQHPVPRWAKRPSSPS